MKCNKEIILQLEELYEAYEKEVLEAEQNGHLMANTRRTYLLHSHNFLKWCKGDFEPGGKNK